MELIEYKNHLFQHVLNELDEKIDELTKVLGQITNEKAAETKSVVGDKFETSRSMMQREEDQIANQIKIVQYQRSQLVHFHSSTVYEKVKPGAVVWTTLGIYYISIPFGKVLFNNEKIYCMSAEAPLANSLLSKKGGDKIIFNQKDIEIRAVC